MKTKSGNMIGHGIRCILLLWLCLALLLGTACAEEILELPFGPDESLYYWGTLPDGGLVLGGSKTSVINDKSSDARLVCLNADRTLRWEYTDTKKNGFQFVLCATVMPDGTIAAFEYTDSPWKEAVQFFTPKGKKDRKTLNIPREKGLIYSVAPSFLIIYDADSMDADPCFRYWTAVYDYKGKEIARYDGFIMKDGYGYIVQDNDELVLYGYDKLENGHAKIMKMEGLQDKTLWETVLDYLWTDTVSAELGYVLKTKDGGYIAKLQEERPVENADLRTYRWRDALVKFDGEGRVMWINRENFGDAGKKIERLYTYDGKIIAQCEPQNEDGWGFEPKVFLWFDEAGKELGTTELALNPANLSRTGKYLPPENDGKDRVPLIDVAYLIPMQDGLWALADCSIWEKQADGELIDCIIPDSEEYVMVKVPEL
ncbi:MAG: hypothetical protein IKZ98_01860 [Clostridia bacterium]|nr:hypothetical protein [Clostridia bacterium]